jgi:PEP-CTERM motif-containing protein
MRPFITSLLAATATAFMVSWPAAATELPAFSAANFDPTQLIDNPYFPMTDTRTYVYSGSDEDGPVDERFEHTNTGPGLVIAGVQTFIQLDREFEDGLLVEETKDYFAQDTMGNVWYLGEDVKKFEYDEDGTLIGTTMEGAWKAGENGALPGFIMPADPTIDFNYFQEHAPNDEAMDQGTIFAFIDELALDIGTFENVLQILETTDLELDAREFKYYAPDVGLILVEEDLDKDFANPELVFELTDIRSAPEPGTAGLLLLGLVAGASARLVRRRTRRR